MQWGDSRRGLSNGWNRLGDDVRAVNEVIWIVAHNSQFSHSRLEVEHHEQLVVHHALPFACCALKEKKWFRYRCTYEREK